MWPSTLRLFLLVAICSYHFQSAVAMFNRCGCGEACIDIRQCDRFGPYHSEPGKWSASLKDEFRRKVCKRENINGVNVYKVCCAKPPPSPPAGGWKRRLDLLDLEQCGPYSADRIAFGKDAKLFEYPWMALLRIQGRWDCGGTLINDRYILTAAHCVRNQKIDYVRLGEFELNRAIDCDVRNEVCAPAPQDIPIERTIIHEDYSARCKLNDIALIRLARPATMNDNVAPICLPVTPEMQTKLPTFFVAGWGATERNTSSNKLQFLKLSLVSKANCSVWLSQVDESLRISDAQVCAKGDVELSDNCVGDSGGPLKSVSVSARFVQYGVVSYGLKSCGKEHAPGVYTRVESYVDWILDKLED